MTEPFDSIDDNSFESFIDADAVADAEDGRSKGEDHNSPFLPGGDGSNGDGSSGDTWSSSGQVSMALGTATSLPSSLPTTPKISGHLQTGPASAGRSPVSSWRNLHSFDYDNELTFNCPYSSAAFTSADTAATTIDPEHPDLHSMPGLSYESMQQQVSRPPLPPHGMFPAHAFHPQLQENVMKWTQGVPYGNELPGMMSAAPMSVDGLSLPMGAGPHRKSFDASQMTGFEISGPAPPAVGGTGSSAAGHHSMHGRSMSLNVRDAIAAGHHINGLGPGVGLAVGTGACSSDDMLKAQAPPMPHAQPFSIKAEPHDAHFPLGGMPRAAPISEPAGDGPSAQASNKKRKVDTESASAASSPASKAKPKGKAREGSPAKKPPRRRPTKAQQQQQQREQEQQKEIKQEEASQGESQVNAANESGSEPKETPAAPVAVAAADKEVSPGDAAVLPAAQTSEDADSAKDSVAMDTDKAESVVDENGTDGSSAASRRKPAQRAKRPPPSASQFTESGKPFPVVDTSATHSTLFVPPDVSGLTRREARLVKNRAAAFLSRQRKREQFEELEKQVGGMSRLVWKMWHTIAGPDAKFGALDKTSLHKSLEGEGKEVFEYLEQVIVAEGSSIAPTEESIANAAAAICNGDTASTDAKAPSPAPAAASAHVPKPPAASTGDTTPSVTKSVNAPKTASGSAATSSNSSNQDKEIAALRAQLEAAQQHASSLQSALAEERTKSSASSTSGSSSPSSTLFQSDAAIGQPGGPLAPFFPVLQHSGKAGLQTGDGQADGGVDSFLSTATESEQLFREGRSEKSGVSPTVAPRTTSVKNDEKKAENGAAVSEGGSGSGAKTGKEDEGSSSAVEGPPMSRIPSSSGDSSAGSKRSPANVALMALMAGLALVSNNQQGTGAGPASADVRGMPLDINVARLAATFAGFNLPPPTDNVFDSASSSSQLISSLAASFARRDDEEEEEQVDATRAIGDAAKAMQSAGMPASQRSNEDSSMADVASSSAGECAVGKGTS